VAQRVGLDPQPFLGPGPRLLLHALARAPRYAFLLRASSVLMAGDAVLTLSVSPDGLSLVSGSSEAVLVLWRLDPNPNPNRTFLPRLGGPLLQLSNTWYPSLPLSIPPHP